METLLDVLNFVGALGLFLFGMKLMSDSLQKLAGDKMRAVLSKMTSNRFSGVLTSYTELIRSAHNGQFAVNISKPGITKGQHWHHTKNEKFVVVHGRGLIQLRKLGTNEIVEFEVSGDKIEVVEMIPGYTHNIINLSDTEDLVTFMWANECFDPGRPDTYFEIV